MNDLCIITPFMLQLSQGIAKKCHTQRSHSKLLPTPLAALDSPHTF